MAVERRKRGKMATEERKWQWWLLKREWNREKEREIATWTRQKRKKEKEMVTEEREREREREKESEYVSNTKTDGYWERGERE